MFLCLYDSMEPFIDFDMDKYNTLLNRIGQTEQQIKIHNSMQLINSEFTLNLLQGILAKN